jgi:ParB family chromosome partitioning protein
MKKLKVIPMKDRNWLEIPINRIKVLNSRSRDKEQFSRNIRSIRDRGLLKPILLNERYVPKTGFYELVCGQGRYLAYKELGFEYIPAEVINVSKKEAYLKSLVENIAREQPKTMEFAYEIKRLYDTGMSREEIGKIIGHNKTYVGQFIQLVEQGEERLIKGVEQGFFPIKFAMLVAQSDDATIQNILMDAYDQNIISTANIHIVRNIIDKRKLRGKSSNQYKYDHPRSDSNPLSRYTVKELKDDITRITREKEAFVNETAFKENRLLALLDGVKTIFQNSEFVALLRSEGLEQQPMLKGEYHV